MILLPEEGMASAAFLTEYYDLQPECNDLQPCKNAVL